MSRFRHIPWITFALAGLAWLVHASPALTSALELNRAAVSGGELWRLLTGHLAHFGADHLGWDAVALLVLGAMCETRNRSVFARVLGAAALAIGLAVWLAQPQFDVYRGLSGLDSALFGLVCAQLVADGLRARHAFSVWLGALALAGFGLKCTYELAAGATVFATGGGVTYAPVPLAHLVGVAVGALGAAQPLIVLAANWNPRKPTKKSSNSSPPSPAPL